MQQQSKVGPNQPVAPTMGSSPMDIFKRLVTELDTEGRYLFLNALANQLRYPNNHTHYFSCVLLFLFAETGSAANQVRPATINQMKPVSGWGRTSFACRSGSQKTCTL